MATIEFSINLREDAANWVRLGQLKRMPYGRSLKDFAGEIPAPVLRLIRARPKQQAIALVHKYLQGRQDNFMTDLKAMKIFLEWYVDKYGNGLLNDIAKLTNKSIYRKTFFATFTLLQTCPYDPQRHWFMVSAKRNMAKQVNTIAHEIFHLQFIHWYYQYCLQEGLSETQFQDLKEALTILLNEPQFAKYHLGIDVGYTSHQRLRKEIVRLWKKKTSYQVFLDACIIATKRNAVRANGHSVH